MKHNVQTLVDRTFYNLPGNQNHRAWKGNEANEFLKTAERTGVGERTRLKGAEVAGKHCFWRVETCLDLEIELN